MDSKQTARLAMLTVTAGIEEATDPAIFAKMPGFNDHFSEFKLGLADIHAGALLQQDHPLVSTEDKTVAREDLENQVLEVSTIINAFAVNTKRAGVAKGYRTKAYVFQKMNDRKLELEQKTCSNSQPNGKPNCSRTASQKPTPQNCNRPQQPLEV